MDAIYLDHAATTAVRPEVVEAMAPYWTERFGNPSSVHRWGRSARSALEESRERIAAVLGASRREILFTGSGTESDNLAVLGRWRHVVAQRNGSSMASVVCSAIEHKAVLEAAKATADEGARLTLLPVDAEGHVVVEALDDLRGAASTIAVVSVQWANNEVGTIQPVARIAEWCRGAGVPFHTDAVQAFGHERVRVDEVPCDALSLSAHKFGGPRGVGVLFARSGFEFAPLQWGGGQEQGLRPGTENVAGAVGTAVAAELAAKEQEAETERLRRLRDILERGLGEAIPGLRVNAAGAERVAHVSNVSIPDVDQEALLMALDLEGIAASSGSACQSGTVEPSHVLAAMGRAAPNEASLRLSLGRTTTEQEVREAIRKIPDVVRRVREALG